MQLKSYWHDTAPPFDAGAKGPVAGQFDVAVIGGGFTGLAAARVLAKAGRSVAVLEAQHVGYGGSGRNGGHLNNGIAHSFIAAKEHLGAERAAALYKAFDASVDLIGHIVQEERIDCDFRRSGKLKLASKPAHYESIARNYEVLHGSVDPDTELLSRGDLAREIGSDAFFGGMLQKKSAMVHMGRYVNGLADAAARHGAQVFERAPVTARKRAGEGWALTTPRGELTANKVILATGAYTSGPFGWFRRRIVPMGSFIVATRPLSEAEAAATLPGLRTYVTSLNIGNYFRLSPDNRLIFGGRAQFSGSDAKADARAGEILRESMVRYFPHLANVGIDYCWGGLVDMTQDRFPRAGEAEGLLFAMGYSGHGAQMSSLMGTILAETILGQGDRNPMKGLPWNAIPGYFGKPWFLPIVGAYYRFLDRIQ
ncbi:glycine/D-amino acid oxidase-like deaminating enzyme [Pseudochelatococcus lubricantis]|uniref:Glycine/D-amino acid oxidase-like deaminating enzyme n=1 Tax=Pseudochelatococcus lubricantis TaxID=1538102 RepID=A0ABX0V0B5_9HYPH|nr:FAD-binding oxidoreductase [Pseudochelatococcus lubricantis]NIJ57989.1 glycine/D-amino acid oxidase-like deaminating enzyme [Pseudochelatococcus lubricantis]